MHPSATLTSWAPSSGTRPWRKRGVSYLEKKELKQIERIEKDNHLELHKVKQRQPARKQDKAEHEQELEGLQWEKALEGFETWGEQNDLHLQQARLCSKIHIREGWAKPIHLLA